VGLNQGENVAGRLIVMLLLLLLARTDVLLESGDGFVCGWWMCEEMCERQKVQAGTSHTYSLFNLSILLSHPDQIALSLFFRLFVVYSTPNSARRLCSHAHMPRFTRGMLACSAGSRCV